MDQTLRALAPMSLVVATWVPLFLLFAGIGLLVARACRQEARHAETWFRCFWLGWALSLVFLQLWHLWLPVDRRALALLGAAGAAGVALHRRELWHLIWRAGPRNLPACLVLLLVVLRLANRAIAAPTHSDAGYYHLTAIRWACSYPIVPGLGNLHHPLAINSVHFLYVALLEAGPWAGRSYHVANGLLLLAAFLPVLTAVFRAFRRGADSRLSDVFLALTLPALMTQVAVEPSLHNMLFVHLVSSPTPDLPVFVLGILLSRELLALIEGADASRQSPAFSAANVTALCVAGTLVKLTFAVMGAAGLAVALLIAARRPGQGGVRLRLKPWAVPVAVAVLAVGTWAARSVILSGYVAYPWPAASVPVEWRMPRESVTLEAQRVQNHARWHSDVLWVRAQSSGQAEGGKWLGPWFTAVYAAAFWTIALPCALALAAGCAAGLLRAAGLRAAGLRAQKGPPLSLLFFVPPACSAAFWFLTAPSPRFAGSVFWAIAAGALALSVHGLGPRLRTAARYVLVASSVILSVSMFSRMNVVKPGPDKGFHAAPRVAMQTYVTRWGLQVLVPRPSPAGPAKYCWDAPLPCTRRPDPDLRLRKEGDLSSGFVLDNGKRGQTP
jgi:hypothetical protein